MEIGFESREPEDLREIQQQIYMGIENVHSEVTRAPIKLPYRNLIRQMLSISADLSRPGGESERLTLQTAVEKTRKLLADICSHAD
jgi:hypothetical protein